LGFISSIAIGVFTCDRAKLAYSQIPCANESGSYVFTFLCASSGAVACTAKPVQAASEAEALTLAWGGEGCCHFNKCGKPMNIMLFLRIRMFRKN
jgi:hypothetical protein